MAFTWGSSLRITLLLLLIAAIVFACFTSCVEKILKDFLLWVDKILDLGVHLCCKSLEILAVAYIPLTVLAVPASVLTTGSEQTLTSPSTVFSAWWGLSFLDCLWALFADSIGATLVREAAFLLGRTIGRSFVVSKLKDYPQFRSVALAIRRSGFKIVLLLRLVPLLPFNMLNYLLSVTPNTCWPPEFLLAIYMCFGFWWFCYALDLTLRIVFFTANNTCFSLCRNNTQDLSDVTHGWSEFSTTRWVSLVILYMFDCLSIFILSDGLSVWLLSFNCGPFRPETNIISYFPIRFFALTGTKGTRDNEDDLLYNSVLCSYNPCLLYECRHFSYSSAFSVSVVLMICVTRVAKSALDKALAEMRILISIVGSPPLPIVGEAPTDFHQPLIIKIDAAACQ
ncbi:hypothetical protein CXB51_022195 [Gossypium anomalum]|uniref:VTT domain-containing protein n=1 Tax=Gossypium anomalum TaxID=47600 RepID=A0A8J5YMU9_9ROSI|nr:hypothetical protein CXB51_022195 [Gossypium anomalum]